MVAMALAAPAAQASFPWAPQGAATDYSSYRLPKGGQLPNDLSGKRVWMYASTADPSGDPTILADRRELNGVRGAHIADAADADQAWRTTTGRPDVTIAILDSGIEWNNLDAMVDVRKKARISRGETPPPVADRATATEAGQDCARFHARAGFDARDLDGDGVFNIVDYACDSRVDPEPARGVGAKLNGVPLLDPQDLLIAFSDGSDHDGNGYVDDIVGWDFLDDDNDPYDDVQYGHGTGESRDSAAEADNGGDLGTCPNCTEIYLRVGTSFIADVNRFAMAVTYATDNGVSVVQEALGTINKSAVAGQAIKYAYDHGTTVIASAADEAAQHHNWPSSYPYAIIVNSVTHDDTAEAVPHVGASYLQFNGCTNFSSRITLAIPSVSCSSDATGRGAGMAGLVYSAALNAAAKGKLEPHPTCHRPDGSRCLITPNEVRQLMASGTIAGTTAADDVNFSQDPLTGISLQPSCSPVPAPDCTDPFLKAPTTRTGPGISYPAGRGHDQFYGYGRVNMVHPVQALQSPTGAPALLPPEVELTSPDWFEMVDPSQPDLKVTGHVANRGAAYRCRVYVAPGSYPIDAPSADGGDFVQFPSGVCNGAPRTAPLDGVLADVSMADLKKLFPATAGDFTGREPGLGEQIHSGRPNTEPYGFVVKVVAEAVLAPLTGEDRRQAYLHHDADLLPGFPKQLAGDGEASPVLADLDGDNRNELIIANSDGVVHAFERDGSEAPGFPVHTDPLPVHLGSPAFAAGAVEPGHGAVVATPAVGDLDRDGVPEVVVADLEDKLYVFGADGHLERRLHTVEAYSGKPLAPFVNSRHGEMNRTQHGFLASPVLADIDGDGANEIIAAALDRHVYAFNADGSGVPGWPVLVVDRSKVASIDPETHQVAFKEPDHYQGALVDTPAVGDIDGDGTPEVVVGSNESYAKGEDFNAGGLDKNLYSPLASILSFSNGRLYAIPAAGEPGGPKPGSSPWLPGWPFKVGILEAEILPLVGEGVTGAPVIADVPCNGVASGVRIGVSAAAGLPYLVDPDGQSCLGRDGSGLDKALPTYGGIAEDQPFIAAFGHPAFASLGGQPSILMPVAGAQRALDAVLPEYQGGHDYLMAWNTATGKAAPGWPAEVNDLQFLTGPTIGDIDGLPEQEVLEGTASDDLQGLTAAGTDSGAGWPKLTGDWTVANPATGSFGTLETDAGTHQAVVSLTRSGRVLAYDTGAPACAPADWPQFHHDRANSGDARRDAIAPGKPTGASFAGGRLRFTAPGDDLLCGTARAYEIRTAPNPIDERSFARASAVAFTATPGAAGAHEDIALAAVDRYVAVRAVDEQGNVGRTAVVDLGPPAPHAQVTPPVEDAGAAPAGGATGAAGGSDAPAPAPASAGPTLDLMPSLTVVPGSATSTGVKARCVRRSGSLRRGLRLAVARRLAPAQVKLAPGVVRASRNSQTILVTARGRIAARAFGPRGTTRAATIAAARACR